MANGDWTGLTGEYNLSTNWSPAGAPSGTAFFSSSGDHSVFFSGNAIVGGWTFIDVPVYNFTIGGPYTVTFTGAGIVVNPGSGGASIANAGSLEFKITSSAGDADITNSGSLDFFDSANAGTSSIVNTGLVQFHQNSSAASSVITNNGTVAFSDSSTAGSATITTGAFSTTQFLDTTNAGSASFDTLANGLVDFQLTTGTLNNNKITAGSINGAGNYNLGANELTVGNGGTQTVSGVISGTGGTLIKIGVGTLILSGTNSYDGGLTTISAGTLQLGNGGTTGSIVDDVFNNSILAFNRCNLYIFDGVISGNGAVQQNGTGTTTLTATNTYIGATTITDGTLALSGLNGSIATSSGVTLTGDAKFDISGTDNGASIKLLTGDAGTTVYLGGETLTLTGGSSIFNGVISNTAGGSLTKGGTGILTLTAAETYTGETTINNLATIALTVNGSVASSSGVTANGTFDVSNISPADANITSLAGNGSVIIGGKNLVITAGDGDTFSGAIIGVGPGGVRLLSGTQTLTGPNNYTGGTFIDGGTLIGTTTGLQGFINNDSQIVFDQDFNGTYSGILNGSGTLTKEGTGIVTLSNVNGYTGATHIDEGVLSIGAANNLGTTSGIVFDGGTLRTTSGLILNQPITLNWGGGTIDTVGNSDTLNGVISGCGDLTKIGSGTLTLTNINTYTGETTISAGTLALTGIGSIANSSGVTANGTFNVAGVTPANDVFIKSLSGSGSVTLGDNTMHLTSASGSFSGVISGTGGLILESGTETLSGANTYGGVTTLDGGVLTIVAANNLGGTSGIVFDGGTLKFNGNFTLNKAITLNADDGIIDTNGTTNTLSGIISGGVLGHLTKIGTGTLTLSGANTYLGGTTVSAGVLQGTTSSLQGDILDNANVTFNQSTLGTYAGNISGSGSVTKTGSGEVILSGSNSYGGGTNINGGTLSIEGDGNLGTGVISFNTGALKFTDSFTIGEAITLTAGGGTMNTFGNDNTLSGSITGPGALTKIGAGILTLTSSGNGYGITNVNGGAVSVFSEDNLGNGGLVFNGGTLITTGSISTSQTVTLNAGGGTIDTESNTDTLSGSVSGGGGLTKTGSGTLILAADTGYSGGTTILDGTLQIGNGDTTGSLQNSGSVANSGVLAFNKTNTYVYSGAISGSGAVHQDGSGTTVLNGANTYAGGTFVNDGTLQVGNGGTTGSIVGNVTDDSILAFNRSNAYSFAGTISGIGAVVKSGAGTLTLTGLNSYSGGTTVNAGGLSISADNNLGNGGSLALKTGTTLSLTESFNLTHAVTIDGSSSFQVSATKLTSVSSVISDSGPVGSLIKTGTGTLELDNNNTYSGGTSVNAGKLLVDGSIVGTTTVNSGGTLGGNGTTSDVTVNSGGTLSPGASAGALSTGTVTLAAGAHFAVELDGTSNYDQLFVGGAVNLGGSTLDLSLGSFEPSVGNSFLIIDNDGTSDAVTGIFAGHVDDSTFQFGDFAFLIDYNGGDGNDVVLTAVPPNVGPPPGSDIIDPNGNAANPALNGTTAGEKIFGLGGNDVIHAGGGADILIGGLGKDSLFGEADADIFDFNKTIESGIGNKRDTIEDFLSGVDKIDLRTIDANTTLAGNQKFKFIVDDTFNKKAGELHVLNKFGFDILEGDTNGDGKADFQIKIVGDEPLIGDILR
jgi:autotransporter-associated beta strand protein